MNGSEITDILEAFLHEICVEYGFCLPPETKREMVRSPEATATLFVARVFEEEGLRADEFEPHYTNLHNLLVSRLGGEGIVQRRS